MRPNLHAIFTLPLLISFLGLGAFARIEPPRPTAPGQEGKLCSRCKTTGRIANPFLDERWKKLEDGCLHCSERLDRDPSGHGFEWIPCKGCQAVELNKQAIAEFTKNSKVEIDWLADRRKIDQTLKPHTKFVHVETPHFQVIFGVTGIVLEDRTVLDQHAAAHLYARRLEDIYSWFQKLIATSDKEAKVLKHQIFLLDDERTDKEAAQQYASLATDRAARVVGDPSILVTWRNKANFKTDAAFHEHVAHHVIHNLCGVFHLKAWLADDAGWLEEGLAHVAEMELFNKAGNTCNVEGTGGDMSDSDWQPVVRKMVTVGGLESFAELMNKKAFMLTDPEHYLAWSYTDFLLKKKPNGLRLLLIALKEKKPQRDALKDVFGLSTAGIDEEWQKYVLANYRQKPLVEK